MSSTMPRSNSQCITAIIFVVCTFEQRQWSPSPFQSITEEITEGVGHLDINSTSGTAKLSTFGTDVKPENRRGRPKKPLPLSKVEQQQRQQKANFRERKRMLELNRLFKELKKTLPRNYQILCKKDILIQVSLHP